MCEWLWCGVLDAATRANAERRLGVLQVLGGISTVATKRRMVCALRQALR